MNKPTPHEIIEAKELLKRAGFFTDNLWCNEDVQGRFKCTDEQAQSVLNDALTNEYIVEQIHHTIRDLCITDANFEEID